MEKKIISFITTFLILFNAFCCYSIVGENVKKIEKLDDYDVNVSCENNSMKVYPFETAVYGVVVTNVGNLVDTYILDCPDLIDCCYWSSLSVEVITLNPGKSGIVVLTVEPYYVEEATYTITVRATSTSDPLVNDSIPTFTTVILDDRMIDVSTDKPFYYSGEPVVLSLTNIADEAIEGNPTFEVFNEDHELVYGCYPECWITLMPGESFSDEWISNAPIGKYTVEGIFLTYEETYFDDGSFFILGDNIIEVTTDKKIYESGEMVNLRLTNIGDNVIDGNPTFLIYNFDGDLVYEVYIYLWIELEPGETFDEIWWDQKDKNNQQVPDGNYRLVGQLTASENETYVDDCMFYIGENLPPNPPSVDGPRSGKTNIAYQWNFTSVDPENDDIFYQIDWGDGDVSVWYGPYSSGELIPQSHVYELKGIFIIRSKAKDIYDSESDWTIFEVKIPRNKGIFNIHSILIWLLERFPILKSLLEI